MSRHPRVLSIVRGADAGAARPVDPALDATSFAVADDIDLTVVLKDRGVELGLDGVCCEGATLSGLAVPAAEPGLDLRGLIASGVRVHAVREDLMVRGIEPAALLAGIEPLAQDELAALILAHDVTLTTSC